MIWATIIFLVTISILVTVHEFGHFIIARLCGVRVECFSVGFGKKLCSYTTKKGTEFKLSIIPLGGYVKMLDGTNKVLQADELRFAFNHQTIFKRVAIVCAGPVANFLFAFFVYWAIFQIGVVSYPVKFASVTANTPAANINIVQEAELKSIAGIKVDSWADVNVALVGEMGKDNITISYETADHKLHEQSVSIKGWRFDIEKESSITAFGFVPAPIAIYPIISQVVPDSAADKIGLQAGDTIIAYNGQPYDNWNNFSTLIKAGQPIMLAVNRGGARVSFDLLPNIEVNSKGEKIGVAGIYPSNNTIIKQYDIVNAFSKGIEQTGLTIKLVARSFYQLLTGVIGLKNLSGPVSIAQGAGQTASYGVVPYLFFLAFISISLGVINLVPLPMLDGGHLVFLLIEKIKGSPVSSAIQGVFYRLGFLLLLVIMSIALFNDFIRLS
ncbi:regulator of sigma E protease [Orbus hercynius]|uniref:Zinc metalloprotease n=1 Tax=Orbus hercynius TaxID=593135 RepID=A0A495RBH3_9GAMM|nr:RIP metalloprotease RseP [Orbus hercynius]RKS84749.1 regulator of sigma E protease [Orbus hercynius]